MKIFTIGYSGRKPEEIQNIIIRYDGVLLDIRYSAKSRNPAWNKKRLEALLPDKYLHLWEWGNVNYKGGDIDIADYEYGLSILRAIIKDAGNIQDGAIFLMCVCENHHTCHRSTIADMLRTDGYEVEEYG